LILSAAVQEKLFWFRSHLLFSEDEEQGDQPRWERKTMDDIFNGTNGLCSLVETYMETLVDVDAETVDYIKQVVAFVSQKASGKLCTTASWMRTFIQEHKDYKKVSLQSLFLSAFPPLHHLPWNTTFHSSTFVCVLLFLFSSVSPSPSSLLCRIRW
jgi:Glutamate-cysteine ligase